MKARSFTRLMPLAVAMLLMLAAGCQYILPTEEEPLAPPLLEPKDVVYTSVEVTRGDMVRSVQGVGRFESVKMVDVYFETGGGRVKSTNVKIGSMVKKGDVLMELDVDDLDHQLVIEHLQLTQMENNFKEMKKYVRNKTQLKNAEIDLEIKKLNVQYLEQRKENATLRSPIDGSVVYVTNARQGGWVDAYSTLVRVADQTEKMLTYIDEANRVEFQIGMKVQVTLKNNDRVIEGQVVSTPFEREKYDEEKLNKMIFIQVPDDIMQVAKVGDEAKIVLILAERHNVLKLPRNVVRTYMQRKYVQVLENGVKVEKDVQVGLETTTEVEILTGLLEGEKVIVR